MKEFFIFCSILIISGCCGSEVAVRKVEVKTPGIIDTLDAEKFKFKIKFKDLTLRSFDELRTGSTQGDKDSLIEGIGYRGISIKEGTKDTAAIAEFIPALKKFVIQIPERVDTIFILDTIRVKPADLIIRGNDNPERIIWIISFTLTTIFIMIYKRYLNA